MRVAILAAALFSPAAAAVDEARLRMIEEINAKPGVLWKAGVNPRFEGLPVGAAKSLCGVKAGNKERLQKLAAEGKIAQLPMVTTAVPTAFDSATNWPKCAKVIGDIRDQSNCGCCWAFGAAEAASDRLCVATDGAVQLPLSAQETCFCAEEGGCDGGMLDTAWSYIQSQGLSTGNQYQNSGPFSSLGLCSDFSLPHCHHHGPRGKDPYPSEGDQGCPSVTDSPSCPNSCDSSASAPYNDFKQYRYSFTGSVLYFPAVADMIAAEIMAHGPVECAFDVYSDFENYVSGIYHHTSGSALGGHAVKMVGWGEENSVKYWKIANSWNPYWGENGYFRIVRGTNECNIEEQVVANSGTWNGPGITGKAAIVV